MIIKSYCINLISTVLSTCSPIVAASPWPSATNDEPRDFKPSSVSLKKKIYNLHQLKDFMS